MGGQIRTDIFVPFSPILAPWIHAAHSLERSKPADHFQGLDRRVISAFSRRTDRDAAGQQTGYQQKTQHCFQSPLFHDEPSRYQTDDLHRQKSA